MTWNDATDGDSMWNPFSNNRMEWRVLPLPSFPQKSPEKIWKLVPKNPVLSLWYQNKQPIEPTLIPANRIKYPACLYYNISLWACFSSNRIVIKQWKKRNNAIKRKQANKLFCMKLAQETKKDERRTENKVFLSTFEFSTFSFSAKPRRGKSSKPSSCWGCSGNPHYQHNCYCCYHFHYHHYYCYYHQVMPIINMIIMLQF